MKYLIFFSYLIISLSSAGQCNQLITDLDNIIAETDNITLMNSVDEYYRTLNMNASKDMYNESLKMILKDAEYEKNNKIEKSAKKHQILSYYTDILIDFLKLDNNKTPTDEINKNIGCITNYKTIFWIYEQLNERLRFKKNNPDNINESKASLNKIRENLKIVEKQLSILSQDEFSEYRNTDVSRQLIKGVNVYHDNDVFILPLKWNKDRNYTGGGRLEITTDYFKMRVLPTINNRKILSYQGVFYGVEAYTPYIRFGAGEEALRDSSYLRDRPFGSYQYWGKSKYRINYNGVWKWKSDFRVGYIGKLGGQKVQDIIHRDILTESVHVQKWESQIANGGRLAINFDHYFDLSLFSNDGDVFNPTRRFKSVTEKNKYYQKFNWFNLYSPIEAHLGNHITSLGLGLGVSNMSFKDRSGNMFFNIPENRYRKTATSSKTFNTVWNFTRQHIFFDAAIKYRYVFHNAMLEGFGFGKNLEADGDGINDEKRSVYYLNSPKSKGTVIRNLCLFEFTTAIKNKKTTFFWKYTINSREFQFPEGYIKQLINFANSIIPSSEAQRVKYFVGDIEAEKLQKLRENSSWNQMRELYESEFSVDKIEMKLYNRKWDGFASVGVNFIL